MRGNRIGTEANCRSPLGNGFAGTGSAGAVGFFGPDAPNTMRQNVIAHNANGGVSVHNSTSEVRISRNLIYRNNGLGIDLNRDGVTPNDPDDVDAGPNGYQNYPVLMKAKTKPRKTVIRGKLNSAPNSTFVVEFFSNPRKERGGKKYLGKKRVTTTGLSTVARFRFVPKQRVRRGWITTTATAPGPGHTSEFSKPKKVER